MSQIMIIFHPWALETEVDVPQPPDHVLLPKQYFIMFVDRDIIGNLVYQTNLYSVQKTGVSIRTTVSEIERYIGIHMIVTIVKMPTYRIYWS